MHFKLFMTSKKSSTYLHLENQCPVCLKILSSKKYLLKHLFANKKKCSAPDGHIPPFIDYEKQIIGEIPLPPQKIHPKQNEKSNKAKIKDLPPHLSSTKTRVTKQINEKTEGISKKVPVKSQIKIKKQNYSNQTNERTSTVNNDTTDNDIINTNTNTNTNINTNTNTNTNINTNTNTNTNTVTNRYTIAVDTNGNIVNLPNLQTQNEILKNNPALLEQVRQIVKNLNINNNENYRLPPEVAKCQKKIETILEEFGDVNTIINCGLNKDLNVVDTIISINSDDENNNVYIERITIPEDLRVDHPRDLSFIEIIYRGLYYILTNLISHKFHYFEMTRSKKAYDDCNKIMKYRKMVLISYLVLKKRLDKLYLLNKNNSEFSKKLLLLHHNYCKHITPQHLPYVHQYDNCMLVKLQMASNLNSIELQSLNNFYENFCHLINIYEFKQIINNAYVTLIESNHMELTEAEVKRRPDYKYINIDHLSIEHKMFPDYDFEIISRDFCSHLVKVTPITFPRKTTYKPMNCYYKRIYIDNSCEAPLPISEYDILSEIY